MSLYSDEEIREMSMQKEIRRLRGVVREDEAIINEVVRLFKESTRTEEFHCAMRELLEKNDLIEKED